MEFEYSDKVQDLRSRLRDFMQTRILPAEAAINAYYDEHPQHWGAAPALQQLKQDARERGLWNLFLPESDQGAGLSNLEYAPLAELTGWSPQIAPEALNCSPPDTGNMELLYRYGTPAQKEQWLQPLLAGEIRSCFSMTEPAVASSDANNIELRIRREGDHWVFNGIKWWSTAALRPDTKVAMVMGVTDPEAAAGARHSIVLVPLGTPGMTVLRSTRVLGFDDRHEGGHGVIEFKNVRVPVENLLGPRGQGFAVAQARLGPGRIHHCMRLIGMAERAIAAMCARAKSRVAFGKPLAEQGVVQQQIGDARCRLDAVRLLVLRAAWRMDHEGNKAARHDIAAAKILVPQVTKKIIDDAIQIHGGGGLSQDTPLAMLYAQARFLQIADGPDEVHYRSVALAELKAQPELHGGAA